MNTYDLSDDHKPENEEETKRITEAGGFVSDGRVNGELSLSRAIGDTYYKQNKNLSVDKQCITCVPEITVRKRKSADSFLVLACDGLWDCLTSAEASTWVREAIQTRKADEPRQKVVEDIMDEIVAEDANDPQSDGIGTDNMTCVLIEFNSKPEEQPNEEAK